MIRVYHNQDLLNSNWPIILRSDFPVTINRSLLTLVAEVDTDSLEKAYWLTNTEETFWWDKEGVTPLFDDDN